MHNSNKTVPGVPSALETQRDLSMLIDDEEDQAAARLLSKARIYASECGDPGPDADVAEANLYRAAREFVAAQLRKGSL